MNKLYNNKILVGLLLTLAAYAIIYVPITRVQEQTQDKETKERVPMTIITRPSGLAFEVLHQGIGDATPKPGQQVTVHYTGWLGSQGIPGKKFDSSLDRKTPFTFIIGAGKVIKGWDEGVLEMKQGEKRRLIIPASLGYGVRGCPGVIPPNAELIFDVELIEIK